MIRWVVVGAHEFDVIDEEASSPFGERDDGRQERQENDGRPSGNRQKNLDSRTVFFFTGLEPYPVPSIAPSIVGEKSICSDGGRAKVTLKLWWVEDAPAGKVIGL